MEGKTSLQKSKGVSTKFSNFEFQNSIFNLIRAIVLNENQENKEHENQVIYIDLKRD